MSFQIFVLYMNLRCVEVSASAVSVCRLLIIDNFIPPDDKHKILARAEFDEEEDTWRLKALSSGSVEFGFTDFC